MNRIELQNRIYVALLEYDTNVHYHGEPGQEMTYKDMARVAIKTITDLGLLKDEDDNTSGTARVGKKHNSFEPL